jgi:tetratricopeptide (TPR) repeat protein
MQFAHERGVIHRDMKPANVLMADCGLRQADSDTAIRHPPSAIPKIADFGLARQLLDGENSGSVMPTESGAILGTPNYMAPEQTKGQSDMIGPAADVYSLGAILYECLTGRPPFRAATAIETLDQVRGQEPVSPRRLQPKLSRELETICLKCLDKSPVRRYESAAALADDLDRWLRGEPVHARPVSPVGRAVKWARRNPAVAMLSTALVVTVVAGVLIYNARLRSDAAEARRLQERAEAQYQDARDTLQQMLNRINTYAGSGIPKLAELRREQQQDALAFFLKVAEQQGNDPNVRFDVAQARYGAGSLQSLLGRGDESLQNLRRAKGDIAALVAEFPDRRNYRVHYVNVLKMLGGFGDLPVSEAEAHVRQALDQAVELVRSDPKSVVFRSTEADVRITLGSLLYTRGADRRSEVEPHYRRAAMIYEELSREQPDVANHRYVLAKAYLNLSVLMGSTDRSPREYHDKAAAILEQVYRDNPNDDVIDSLAVLRMTWAYAQESEGKTEDAIRDLDNSIAMLNDALKREPNHVMFRDRLYRTHGVRAEILDANERFAESAADWDKVLEFCASPQSADSHRPVMALALVRCGQQDRAVALIEDWSKRLTAATPPDQLSNSAAVYALALESLRSNNQMSVQQPSDGVAEKYVERALHFLGKAKQAYGAQGWPAEAAKISQDKRFKSLQDNPEFQRLITIDKK